MAITRTQLARYDGKGGNPAYVAYGGRVYDVSKVFRNGEYNGLKAGTDLTDRLSFDEAANFLERNGIIVGGISDE